MLEMKHLVIGGGSIGKRHLNNLYSLGETKLFCFRRFYDKDFEAEYHCKVVTSYDEIKHIKPDILYVCNPTSMHHYGLLWAQDLGAHVFMEKPLTHDEHILHEVLQQWKQQRVFFIGFVMRYHPFISIIKERINHRLIGDVFSARFEFGSYLPNRHPWENYREGYAAIRSLGGGVINTITHELDLMLDVFGIPQSVLAAKANPGHLQLDVEELAEAIFRYPWGFATLHLDFLQKDYDRQIKILGTEGKIVWNWKDNEISIYRYNEPKEIIELKDTDFNQYYIDELKDFFELISLNKIQHSLDFDYAITNTQWMLAMHKSAETQKIWEI
jgi:predicted dehydrogenase